MGMQAQVIEQAKPTRRQLAAQKRAEAGRKAKAWLATRKHSRTPVADRLVSKYIGEGWEEASAREHLINCLKWERDYGPMGENKRYRLADTAAAELRNWRFSSDRNAFADAVALMQEQGIPPLYWQNRQDPFAA